MAAGALTAQRAWASRRPPAEVWATILDFDAYRSWWPWLTELEVPALLPGARARAVVRAPAGYRLRLDLTLAAVDPPRRVDIAVTGDVAGTCTVTVADHDGGTAVGLAWSLAPRRRLLRALDRLARPVLVRGHDHILDDGLRRCRAATGLDLTDLG